MSLAKYVGAVGGKVDAFFHWKTLTLGTSILSLQLQEADLYQGQPPQGVPQSPLQATCLSFASVGGEGGEWFQRDQPPGIYPKEISFWVNTS